jgi:two-component system, NarL family, sensor kinase
LGSGANTETAGTGKADAGPILIECDRVGRIIGMTARALGLFGEANHLTEVLWKAAPSGREGLLRLKSAARFSPVFQSGDSIWISAELAARGMEAVREQTAALAGIETGLVRHYFRLQSVERSLASLTRQLRRAGGGRQAVFQVERERRRLGRELHTGVGQLLAAIRLQLEVIQTQRVEQPVPVRQALDRIGTLAGEALEAVRSVSHRLHPPAWQSLSLADALGALWETSGVPQAFQAEIELDPAAGDPPLESKILLYRAAQEAISNLTRHAHATRCRLELRLRDGQAVLTFEDNGIGFNVERVWLSSGAANSGIGLRSIQEHADAVGGRFLIQSGPKGTKLEVSAPLAPAAPAAEGEI